MDLLKILDTTPEPPIIDPNNFTVDPVYSYSNDYKIITPLTDFQKELFDQIVSLHYSDILKFYIQFQNNDANLKDKLIIDSLKVLLENSSLVSNHPYLLIDHFFPKTLTSRDVHKKLIETSGKFKILNDLLNIIESLYTEDSKPSKSGPRTSPPSSSSSSSTSTSTSNNGVNFNLVIVSRPGKCMDLIESLLLSHNCNIKRYAGDKLSTGTKSKKTQQQQQQQTQQQTQQQQQQQPQQQQQQDDEYSFEVHLLSSEIDTINMDMYETDLLPKTNLNLLISFDISVNTEDKFIADLLQRNSMPIIRLVPNNTIEHIALYFRKSFKDKNDMNYLKPVTAAIVCLRDKVGLIPSELKSIYATNLKYLTEWFKQLSPTTLVAPETAPTEPVSWPLPDLRPVRQFHSNDVEKSLLKEVKFVNDEDELLQLPNHYKIRPKTKESYYKSKRLQASYITNPIEYESYNKITGISSNIPENTSILTHKLILNYNLILQRYEIAADEYECLSKIEEQREQDHATVQATYNKIEQEVAELRKQIAAKNSDLNEKQTQVDTLKLELKEIDDKIEVDEKKLDYLKRKELKDAIDAKVVSKKQENEYMLKEIENAKRAMEESLLKIDVLKQENSTMRSNLESREVKPFQLETNDNSKLIKSNNDLMKVLEKNLRKINDIPISQKLRINGVNNNIFGGQVNRR